MVPNLSQSDKFRSGQQALRDSRHQFGWRTTGRRLLRRHPVDWQSRYTLDPGGSQADVKLWDVERIEALKGPQGTLYGNGSMGGTIRIISEKPDLSEFGVAGEAGVQTTRSGDESYFAKGVRRTAYQGPSRGTACGLQF